LLILQEEPVPSRSRRPEIPEKLAAVVHRALAKELAGRFADVRVLRQALLAAVAGLTSSGSGLCGLPGLH
jgi:hypothetical protein